jgi:hypothetical protein
MGLPQLRATHPHEDLGIYALDEAGGYFDSAVAVRALQGSPADRSRSGAHMVALATYMGHVNIYSTYWYLEATADLMRDVASAGEGFFAEGRQS